MVLLFLHLRHWVLKQSTKLLVVSNGVLSNIAWSYTDGQNYMYLTYIKINGILLVDPGVVDPNAGNTEA